MVGLIQPKPKVVSNGDNTCITKFSQQPIMKI